MDFQQLAAFEHADLQGDPTMDENWVTIRSYATLAEAEVIRSVLESDGIEVAIPDQNTAGLGLPVALGDVHVYIKEEDVARAEEVLAATVTPQELSDEDSDPLM